MTFNEKLKRLTEDRIKAKLSRRIQLPATAVQDMLSKGYVPNAAVAFRLARALGVSLDWLMDDEQEWPPVWGNARVPETAGAAA